eukprot:scaffold5257_cov23-Cyclotella_meneghiniana.AAC.1
MLDNVASVFSGGSLAHFWVAHYNRDYLNVPRFGDENYEEKAERKEESAVNNDSGAHSGLSAIVTATM